MPKNNKITYQTNPNLPIIKKGWKGNVVINGEFHNSSIPEKPLFLDVLKWKLGKNPQREEKKKDTFKLESCFFDTFSKTEDTIIWLGHSSFLITLNGKTILTDPCFYDIPTAKRLVKLPCKIETLNNIDYILLSHDHRDHFDVKSIKELVKINPNVEILTSLNFKKLLSKNKISTANTQEAGWYQKYKTEAVEIIFLPAKHWGRRSAFDFNKILWGSFLIKTKDVKIFFSGDTAYDDKMFKEIQSEFGNIDICLLPISAYSPAFIMKQSHTTPEEAYQIFNDLKGELFIPMHYGTYDLSDEPLGEPIKRLNNCFKKEEIKLKIVTLGDNYNINS